jgi:predicted DCC family thiol-disulfide oxidoreductase YuxK
VVNTDYPVVLFDGVCNYCNTMVNFAIRNDSQAQLKFTPLQTLTGKQLKSQFNLPPEIDSVIFIDNNKVYVYADAALRICRWLDWPAKALYAFIIVPKFIRQPIYKWIAKNRYKWFGKKDTCIIPTPEVKSRFLD